MVNSKRSREFVESYPTLFLVAYQAAFRLNRDRELAQDLAQEALIRAYVRWDRLDTRKEGWIVTTTARLAIDHWRREQRRPRSDSFASHADAEAKAAQRLDLVELLASLPRRQREVAVLRYVADRSEREVAEHLGCSVGSVKRHASRAASALRARIDPPQAAGQSEL